MAAGAAISSVKNINDVISCLAGYKIARVAFYAARALQKTRFLFVLSGLFFFNIGDALFGDAEDGFCFRVAWGVEDAHDAFGFF